LLGSAQSHTTDEDINKVIEAVKGKPVHQLIAEGQTRLGSSAPTSTASAPKPAHDKKEAPKK
jgi:ribosomal protein L12E/L44/L45/RPP1/RPP2